MTQVKFNNGSIVEDTFTSEHEDSQATEVYVWQSILKDFAYSFANEIESSDDDLNAYIGFLKNIEVEGQSLGAIQAKATDFTTDDYLEATGLGSAISLQPANETEQKVANRLVGDLSERNESLMAKMDEISVPTTPDQEEMPLLVASNERSKGLHTLEEAKEMWKKFLGHLDVETNIEPETTSGDESNDEPSDSDSDQQSVNDPTRIEGVGSKTVDKLESNGFEIVPALNASEHIEVEPFGFEESDETSVPELLTSDVKERYEAVKGEMDEMDTEIVKNRIISGDLHDAVDTIEDYE